MLLAYDQRIKDAGGGFQRVYGRIDTEFRDLAAEDGCCVQVRKGSRRSWVCQVIGRNIHRLYGGDRAFSGRSDTFRLVTYGGRHTPQQGGNLGTGLGETEDIIDEE